MKITDNKFYIQYLKQYALYLKWFINKPSYPLRDDNKLYLHLGSGIVNLPGYVNIDAIPMPHIHHVQKQDGQDRPDLSSSSSRHRSFPNS